MGAPSGERAKAQPGLPSGLYCNCRARKDASQAGVSSFVIVILSSGTRLGAFEILSFLGAGGMGEVYSARDTRLDRTVAIKILRPDKVGHPERFTREARAVSRLSHPHICSLYDIGEQDGMAFLVMEYPGGANTRRPPGRRCPAAG